MRQKKNREIKKGIPYTEPHHEININPTGSNTWGAPPFLPFYTIDFQRRSFNSCKPFCATEDIKT